MEWLERAGGGGGGVNVRHANAIGSQLSLNFCSKVAPRPNFEASHVIYFVISNRKISKIHNC